MATEERFDWQDKSALLGRIEQQLEELLLIKELLREGLLDRQQAKTALSLRRQIGVSLATSLVLSGGISLDALATTLQHARHSKA